MTWDPTRHPGLAYRHAFDWLALQLHAAAGPVAALAPSVFHAGELLRRLPHLALLPPTPDGLEAVAAALGSRPNRAMARAAAGLRAAAWPEPAAATGPERLPQIHSWLQPGGHLYLVAADRLAPFLAERRSRPVPPALDAARATALLREHHFRVVAHTGLHGPRAIAWHYAAEAAACLGQLARRDRAHFAMRRDFVETGPGRRLSALALITAERRP